MKRVITLLMLGLLVAVVFVPTLATASNSSPCRHFAEREGYHTYEEAHCCGTSRCEWYYRDCYHGWGTKCYDWKHGGSYHRRDPNTTTAVNGCGAGDEAYASEAPLQQVYEALLAADAAVAL